MPLEIVTTDLCIIIFIRKYLTRWLSSCTLLVTILLTPARIRIQCHTQRMANTLIWSSPSLLLSYHWLKVIITDTYHHYGHLVIDHVEWEDAESPFCLLASASAVSLVPAHGNWNSYMHVTFIFIDSILNHLQISLTFRKHFAHWVDCVR